MLTTCSDDDASFVDLNNLNREYNLCLKLGRFDEFSSFCGGLVDPIHVAPLEKIDDDSLEFVSRIQSSIKAPKSKLSDSKSYLSRVYHSPDFDLDSDEASFKRFMHQMCT